MEISNDFKNAIANAFYDKEVFYCEVSNEVDSEGWQRISEPTVSEDSFMANVRFNDLAQLQEENGIKDSIDIAITCLPDTDIEVGEIVSYSSTTYKLEKVLVFDSHKLLIGKIWRSQSSTLPSA
jgi:ATP adenylyltransferase/5',5'''-P-1,P-4-tetraphosphate phosphorylase II